MTRSKRTIKIVVVLAVVVNTAVWSAARKPQDYDRVEYTRESREEVFVNNRSFILCVLLAIATFAAHPAHAEKVIVEAESFTVDGNGWTIREHEKGAWYAGRPSKNVFLGGQAKDAGTATTTISLPKAGSYKLWVRYLDMTNYRAKNGFVVTGVQAGKNIFQKAFDNVESVRATSDGVTKWGIGFARWVWDGVEFTAEPGDLHVALGKVHSAPVHGCGRNIDVVILSDDPTYEPNIMDLYPLYVKIRILSEQPHPVGIHAFGKRPFSPWYMPHANINKRGLFVGASAGLNTKDDLLSPGDESPWVNIAPFLAYGGENRQIFYALRSYYERETEAYFEVAFSRTPSEEGLIRTVQRTGSGDCILWTIDLTDYTLETEIEGSLANLERAKAVPDAPGRMPTRFPFFTGLAVEEARSIRTSYENERQALKTIGIAGDLQRPSNFYFHLTESPGCLSGPIPERIDEHMRSGAMKIGGDFTNIVALNAMDEPGFDFEHIEACDRCKAGFRPYLESIGAENPDELVLNNDPTGQSLDKKRSYYYTRRYLNYVMTEMLRAGTVSANKFWPNVPVTVNFATEILSGNMVKRGLDWYEIFNSGALSYGWGEDWASWTRTYQTNGFHSDAMRSACRRKGLKFGIYNVLGGSTAWEIQAKGTMEIGHGHKAISFFNYGPAYAISSDTNSTRPEIHEGIKWLTFATGQVEDVIMDGATAIGDVAMLLSVTGDIWHATTDNVFGRERMYLNLLLRHCNVATDVLGEEELPLELGRYRMLFATDSHLRREFVPAIVDWVHAGGTLYVGAGALQFDEFGQPLGLLEQFAVTRPEFELSQQPGRPQYEMLRLNAMEEHDGMTIVCGRQGEPLKMVDCRKGRVACIGFFPAISYISTATKVEDGNYSTLDFPEAHRVFMNKVLADAAVRPRLTTDNYLVEANLIEAENADLIVLSNWTGMEQTVRVCLDGPNRYESVTMNGKPVDWDSRNNSTGASIHVCVGAGGFIECRIAR